MKLVFKHEDLQMFGLKLNKYEEFSCIWMNIWVKIYII